MGAPVARTLDSKAHAIRRDAFIDVAERLVHAKGYEQMSIQDVLDASNASKGAFYHYFASKADLREAVIGRMADAVAAEVRPVVEDPGLSAVQKLEGVFGGIARWKGERTELLQAMLEVWLADDNAIVRERFRHQIAHLLVPILTSIIAQGQAEGAFTTSSAEAAARVLVSLVQGLNESATELYFARQANAISFEEVERRLAAYADAFERVLGLPAGSWPVVDPAVLRQWYG
jgi:AcrR family transcriptional regulator